MNDKKKDVYRYIYSGLPVDKTREVFKAYEDGATAQRGIQETYFLDLINRYFAKIKGALSEDESKELLQSIKKLEFDDVSHEFRLIDEKGYEKFDLFVDSTIMLLRRGSATCAFEAWKTRLSGGGLSYKSSVSFMNTSFPYLLVRFRTTLGISRT